MGILKYIESMPTVERVEKLPPHETNIPNDKADWASMHSSTYMKLDEYVFDRGGIAFFTSEEYEYSYQYVTDAYIDDIVQIQRDVGIDKYATPESDGLVHSSEAVNKYTLQDMIASLTRTVLKDGYLHGSESITVDDITVAYTVDESRVTVVILW